MNVNMGKSLKLNSSLKNRGGGGGGGGGKLPPSSLLALAGFSGF